MLTHPNLRSSRDYQRRTDCPNQTVNPYSSPQRRRVWSRGAVSDVITTQRHRRTLAARFSIQLPYRAVAYWYDIKVKRERRYRRRRCDIFIQLYLCTVYQFFANALRKTDKSMRFRDGPAHFDNLTSHSKGCFDWQRNSQWYNSSCVNGGQLTYYLRRTTLLLNDDFDQSN